MTNIVKTLCCVLIPMCSFISAAPAVGENSEFAAVSVPAEILASTDVQNYRDNCPMAHTSETFGGWASLYRDNWVTVTYFDPYVECGHSQYEITSFSFTLFDPGGYEWPQIVWIKLYDLAVHLDPCGGPGSQIQSYGLSADEATFGRPNVGTVTLPTPWSVSGPFFIGLSYAGGDEGSTPSVCFDNTSPEFIPPCNIWLKQGSMDPWENWEDVWGYPYPGWPMFWVGGENGLCSASIGEADGSGAIDIDDVVYLITYIFSGGDPPIPFAAASGDADCSCSVDIDDVVYLITYIFSGGPPPCDCNAWVAACGALP